MSDILKAICNLVESRRTYVGEESVLRNRANNMGEAFEVYVKNVFAGTFGINGSKKQERFSEVFSYQGSASKPPDLMLRGGDAIEIKKLETCDSQIQLNSSFPKNYLHWDDSRLALAAKTSEEWTQKDILYVVGNLDKKTATLRSMWWIYGDCFCADAEVYQSVSRGITGCLRANPRFEFAETNELARINGVDAQHFTDLRVRGMWLLKNPHRIFEEKGYVHFDEKAEFQLFVLMRESKYRACPDENRTAIEVLEKNNKLKISSEKVADPNNPAENLDCKLIQYVI